MNAEQSRHTPGPWTIAQTETGGIVIAKGELGLCSVFGTPSMDGYRKVAEANAYLIAAAPDLLAALKDLAIDYKGTPCFCNMAIGHPLMHEHGAKCLAAQNAIKATEGGT